MMRLEWAGRGRLLSRSLKDRPDATAAETHVFRRESPKHFPSTPISRRLFSALGEAGPTRLENLVKAVADELYREELRNGASVLDIGLFGSRLFRDEVIRELHAGDGMFWEIKGRN